MSVDIALLQASVTQLLPEAKRGADEQAKQWEMFLALLDSLNISPGNIESSRVRVRGVHGDAVLYLGVRCDTTIVRVRVPASLDRRRVTRVGLMIV
ncbi:MAG: hypothetical protein AAB421_05560 [Patescibacteria group bacterium]